MSIGLMYYINPVELQKEFYAISPEHYAALFDNQTGAGLPHFQGIYSQKGQGLLGDLFRNYALPVLKTAAPHIIKGVRGLAKDLRKGKEVKTSIKKRGMTAVKHTADSLLKGKGKGVTKKKTKAKPKKKTSPKKQKTKCEFSLFN